MSLNASNILAYDVNARLSTAGADPQTKPEAPAAAPAAVTARKQPSEGRLACLDAFRGFDILVMIFVNYIAGMAGIPFILRHAKAEMDAYTLTDLVFPGFLFIVGVAIPLSINKKDSGRRFGLPSRGTNRHPLWRWSGTLHAASA